MLSADSYTLPRRRSGRRRWVKLRVHTRRLANIGANAAELRGLMGSLARFFSWLGSQPWEPALVTICRSARSGYLPRDRAELVEELVCEGLQRLWA